jgi:non-ribosomal peptide synthase protein (TIGR01720 family)
LVPDRSGESDESACPIHYVDMRDLDREELDARLEREGGLLQRSIDLETWPLFRVALFDRGPAQGALVLFSLHHLLCDMVSFRLVVAELTQLLQQAVAGRAPSLPPQCSAAVQALGQRLAELACRGDLASHVATWRELASPAAPVPVEHGNPRDNDVACEEHLHAVLPAEKTAPLLRVTPGANRVTVRQRVIRAITAALCDRFGLDAVRIELTGHGRAGVMRPLKVTGTLGWLATHYPVTFPAPRPGPAEHDDQFIARLAQIPSQGETYCILRYLSPDEGVRHQLAAVGAPDVYLNWFGNLAQKVHPGYLRQATSTLQGLQYGAGGTRDGLHNIKGDIHDGQLHLYWTYNRQHYTAATMRDLADSTLAIVAES